MSARAGTKGQGLGLKRRWSRTDAARVDQYFDKWGHQLAISSYIAVAIASYTPRPLGQPPPRIRSTSQEGGMNGVALGWFGTGLRP
jgi:hypothetical protein